MLSHTERERERERERHNLYAHQASRNACVRLSTFILTESDADGLFLNIVFTVLFIWLYI
jgi:hypothetical protein